MKLFKPVILIALFAVLLIFFCSYAKIGRKNSKSVNNTKDGTAKSVEPSATQGIKNSDTEKILIVYFSLTGNTRKAAGMMKDIMDGKLFEIEPDFDYSKVSSKSEMEKLGKEQVKSGFLPDLKNSVKDFDSYDVIIIGSPVWWFCVTPPVMSFLSEYDFKGKTVVPFCTCGSAEGDFFKQLEDAVPDAKVLDGLKITEAEFYDEKKLKEKIETWLEKINKREQ